MIKTFTIENHQLKECEKEEAKIFVLTAPSEKEKKEILSLFNIDEHNLASCFDPEELSRVEFENEHIEMIFKRPKNYSSKDNFLFKVSSMGLFLFPKHLIIVLPEDLPIFSGKYFKHVIGIKEIFLKMIYNSISHFIGHLKVINMIADEIEQKLSHSMENKYLLNMFTLEKSLVYYTSALSSNQFAIEKLRAQAHKYGFKERSTEFMEDLIIENNQCRAQSDMFAQIFAGLMDARASIINNNLNVLMKNLTAIAVAVSIPTFLASLGGMSEVSIITGIDNPKVAHLIFFLVSATIGIISFILFKKIRQI